MEITLDFTQLAKEVKRSLSVIGKRSIDENGNLMFKDITLSSLEEPLLNDYLQQAVIDLVTEADTFITASTESSLTVTFPTNHNNALDAAIAKVCKAYCVSYALYSWFSVVAPRLTEKYKGDCTRQAGALIRLIHSKKQPTVDDSVSPLAPTTTGTTNS